MCPEGKENPPIQIRDFAYCKAKNERRLVMRKEKSGKTSEKNQTGHKITLKKRDCRYESLQEVSLQMF